MEGVYEMGKRMDNCCEKKTCELEQIRGRHRRVLYAVLWINAAMFLIEGGAGLLAHSTSLLADGLDMLGDALIYGFSLFVLTRSTRWQVGAALSKGGFMFVFGIGVLAEAVYKIVHPVLPSAGTMGVIGVLALAANVICFLLLYSHRGNNLNMSSTWLCSRNDLLANAGVLVAAVSCGLLSSQWPDVFVGLSIAGLFVHSAWGIFAQSVRTWRTA
jgi:cation diffusion facilitator family transporter